MGTTVGYARCSTASQDLTAQREQLAVIAEFEANLIRQRTREGMAIARSHGKLRGKQPKLTPAQAREVHRMHPSGDYPIAEIAELFSVSRPTIYRALQRSAASAVLPTPHPAPARCDEIRCVAALTPASRTLARGGQDGAFRFQGCGTASRR